MHLTHNRVAASRIVTLGMLLALMAASLLMAPIPAHASTTFTVNSTEDQDRHPLGTSDNGQLTAARYAAYTRSRGCGFRNAPLMLGHGGMASTSNTRTLSSNSSPPLYRVRFRTTSVPRPGSLRMRRSPLRRLALSCIPLIPFPPVVTDGFSAGSNPRPSSATSTRSLLS
jgi:hypothetical protein